VLKHVSKRPNVHFDGKVAIKRVAGCRCLRFEEEEACGGRIVTAAAIPRQTNYLAEAARAAAVRPDRARARAEASCVP